MTQDRKRQPKGITIGGQYAHEQKAEAAVALEQPASGLPSEAESVDTITTHFLDIATEPAARAMAQSAVDDACVAAGGDVPREWVAAVVAHDTPTRQQRGNTLGVWSYSAPETGEALRGAYAQGMPADWAAIMYEERGEAWVLNCVQRYANGLTAAELERLDEAGLAGTPRKAAAFVGCDTDEVHRWLDAAKADDAFNRYVARYLDLSGIGQYVREGTPLDDVKLCYELGAEPGLARRGLERPDGAVEKGPAAIRELVEYAKACGQSTDEAHEGIRLGVPAAKVKAFGPNVRVSEIAAFEEQGVPAKVARSLRGRDRSISPAEASQLHGAGISTGADYKGWMSVAATMRNVDDTDGPSGFSGAIELARAGVPLTTAQQMRSKGMPLSSIKELHAAGINDIEPWAQALHGQTQVTATWSNRVSAGMHYVAEFAKAGGTPRQLQRAQRAGVPLADAAQHVSSTPRQLWAAGAANRKAYRDDVRRMARRYGGVTGEPTPWDYDGPNSI